MNNDTIVVRASARKPWYAKRVGRTPLPVGGLVVILLVAGVAAALVWLGPTDSETQNLGIMTASIVDMEPSLAYGEFTDPSFYDAFNVTIATNSYTVPRVTYTLLNVDKDCANVAVQYWNGTAFVNASESAGSQLEGVSGGCDFDLSAYTKTVAAGSTAEVWLLRLRYVSPGFTTATWVAQFAES